MTRTRAKTSSSGAVDPPQCGALRPRKRQRPSDKTRPADDVYHQQDTEEVSAACVGRPPKALQSHPKDCVMTSVHQKQAAEDTLITKQDTTEENGVNGYGLTAKTHDMQEITTVIDPNSEVQLEGYTVHFDKDGNEKEQKKAPNCSMSTTKTCMEPTLMSRAMSEEGSESKPSALKDELSTEDNPDHKMETNDAESNSVCVDDVREKEAAVGLPSKKKRRMGMCHLTEKERSQFLQAQNHVNGKPLEERQSCNVIADQVSERETICSPHTSSSPQHDPVTTSGKQLSNAEIKHQSIDNGEDRSHVHICEAKTPRALGPEQTPELLPDGEVVEKWRNQEQQEAVGVSEIPENKTKNMEDVPAQVDHDPDITFHTSTNVTEETMKENHNAIKTPSEQVQVHSDEMSNNMIDYEDNGPKVECSLTDMSAEVISDGSRGICNIPVTLIDSDRTSSCGPDFDPGLGPLPLDTDPPQTRETEDLFGSGGLDYVTDSQLNTIVLTEEDTMNRKGHVGSSDVYEDGTNLICGLIRELSSLNRTVMATHRELENLLYKTRKNSRNSLC